MLFYFWISSLLYPIVIPGVSVTALGGARDRKLLHHALFDHYTTSVRPSLDYSRPTHVTAKLHVATILGLDIKNQLLSIGGFFSFRWTDELLTWNPDDYGGINDIVVPQGMIWRPDLSIYNAVEDDVYIGVDDVLVQVTSKGEVRWEPGMNLRASCKVDIFKYPYDENVCPIELMTWMNDNNSVSLLSEASPISLTKMVSNNEFWVKDQGTLLECSVFHEKFYCTISFLLKLKRRPAFLAMTFLAPVTLLAVLSAVSFLLTPEEPDKVSVAITILLSFTVFLGVIDQDLPETSDTLSLIVVYVDTLLLLSFLSVFGNAVVIVIHRRDLRLAAADSDVMESSRPGSAKNIKALSYSPRRDNVKNLPGATAQLDKSDHMDGQGEHEGESTVSGDQTSRDTLTPRKWTRAEKLNTCFFVLNIIVLLTIIIVVLGIITMA